MTDAASQTSWADQSNQTNPTTSLIGLTITNQTNQPNISNQPNQPNQSNIPNQSNQPNQLNQTGSTITHETCRIDPITGSPANQTNQTRHIALTKVQALLAGQTVQTVQAVEIESKKRVNTWLSISMVVIVLLVILFLVWFSIRFVEPRLVFRVSNYSYKDDFDKQDLPSHIQRVSQTVQSTNLDTMIVLTKLRYFLSAKPTHQGIVIVFHGNASLASDHFAFVEQCDQANMACALVEYPGYAGQVFVPSQNMVLHNALMTFDHIVRNNRMLAEHVVLFGQSLGSCVATFVANQRMVKTLILASCFPSIPKLVGLEFLDWLGIMVHTFDAAKWAKFVRSPVLVLHAERDQLVSRQMCLAQSNNFANSVFYEVKHASHNDITAFKEFWIVFRKALDIHWSRESVKKAGQAHRYAQRYHVESVVHAMLAELDGSKNDAHKIL